MYLCVPRSFVWPTRHPTQVILELTRHTTLFLGTTSGKPFMPMSLISSSPVLTANRRKFSLHALLAPFNLFPPLQKRGRRYLRISSSNFPTLIDTMLFLLLLTGSRSALTSFRPLRLLPLLELPDSSETMSELSMDGLRRSSRIEDNNLPQNSPLNSTNSSASKRHSRLHITLKPMDKPNEPIRNWNNTSESILTLCKTIGQNGCQLPNSPTITEFILQLDSLHSF